MTTGKQRPEDLSGMGVREAKEYMVQHIASLTMTEKRYAEIEADLAKWNSRIALARSRGAAELAQEAEKEAERLTARHTALAGEIAEMKAQLETMGRQLPGLAARERTIDPDLLEQELLMASGYLPGSEAKAAEDRAVQAQEKDAAASAALEALKAQMGLGSGQ
ncbi:MAG: chromosome partitioning protein [Treponema sp.]|jgi:uncharacterized protein involved in exopolysaccharide biosynthesis|nr:chromosome partitioning protein [Treponema sp.]